MDQKMADRSRVLPTKMRLHVISGVKKLPDPIIAFECGELSEEISDEISTKLPELTSLVQGIERLGATLLGVVPIDRVRSHRQIESLRNRLKVRIRAACACSRSLLALAESLVLMGVRTGLAAVAECHRRLVGALTDQLLVAVTETSVPDLDCTLTSAREWQYRFNSTNRIPRFDELTWADKIQIRELADLSSDKDPRILLRFVFFYCARRLESIAHELASERDEPGSEVNLFHSTSVLSLAGLVRRLIDDCAERADIVVTPFIDLANELVAILNNCGSDILNVQEKPEFGRYVELLTGYSISCRVASHELHSRPGFAREASNKYSLKVLCYPTADRAFPGVLVAHCLNFDAVGAGYGVQGALASLEKTVMFWFERMNSATLGDYSQPLIAPLAHQVAFEKETAKEFVIAGISSLVVVVEAHPESSWVSRFCDFDSAYA